jgi:hypothetical protein
MQVVPQLLSTLTQDVSRTLFAAWQEQHPGLAKMLLDPSSAVGRFGDVLVWDGPAGQKVIGGLEMLGESQTRIHSAIAGIDSAQIAAEGLLGVVQTLSIATLGVTALSGAMMAYRLHAMNTRMAEIKRTIDDVDGKIDAQHKAHLKSSLQYLREHENGNQSPENLPKALEEARRAANIYGEIAFSEATARTPRLPVLNLRGRFHAVALLTEIQCLILMDDSTHAIERIEEEMHTVKAVAQTCFDKTLKSDPERFLRSSYRGYGIDLELLAGMYRSASALGLAGDSEISDANSLFEAFRDRTWQGFFGVCKEGILADEVSKLRYLLACLEETCRIASLQILIADLKERSESINELRVKLTKWKEDQVKLEGDGTGPRIFAYALGTP